MTRVGVEAHVGPWKFVWRWPSRTADVFHAEYTHAVTCLQACDWDGVRGRPVADLLDDDVFAAFNAACVEWVRESAADHLRDLPYWRE